MCIYIHTHTHNGILAIKTKKIVIFNSMDGLREYYTQSSKAEKDKYYMMSEMNLYKTEIENEHGCQSGKERREG